ncbi:MAG TPA: hypothetical protein ENI86_18625 [Acidimicrobiales bacterium]|nr:hypothetical protein [Acidimicrobiales bacterium]
MFNQARNHQKSTGRNPAATDPSRRLSLGLRTVVGLVAVIGFLLAAFPASPVSAAPGDFAPTPDTPSDGPVIVNPDSGSLTAEVTPSCTAGTPVAVEISNTTKSSTIVETRVDGVLVDSQAVGSQMAGYVDLGFVENQTSVVAVTAGAKVLFDSQVTLDCLLPAPSYSLTQDCDTGQTFAVLKNTGDDTAHMGIRYAGAPYMLEDVAPHSSIQWLLAVDPGESIGFDVMSGTDVIGSEQFEFVCAPPATVPPATAPPATVPPATVPPATVPPTTAPAVTVPPTTVPPAAVTPEEGIEGVATGVVTGTDEARSETTGSPDDTGTLAAGESLGAVGSQPVGGSSRMGLWIGGSLFLAGLGLVGLLAWAAAQRRRIHAR